MRALFLVMADGGRRQENVSTDIVLVAIFKLPHVISLQHCQYDSTSR